MYMTERKIMKTISEMNQDEKTELLKTIEENRIDKNKIFTDWVQLQRVKSKRCKHYYYEMSN